MSDPEAAKASMIANLPEKTGKSLPEWIEVLSATGLEKHGEQVKHLKAEHGVTHGFANLIAHETRAASAGGQPEPEDLVAAQYSGKKEPLRPILDAVLAATSGFGGDVEVSPKKRSVSLRRSKQFAVVQPSTNSRVDVCIQLKGESATDRLKAAGGMTSHKVGVTSVDQVDDELVGWLRDAYGRA